MRNSLTVVATICLLIATYCLKAQARYVSIHDVDLSATTGDIECKRQFSSHVSECDVQIFVRIDSESYSANSHTKYACDVYLRLRQKYGQEVRTYHVTETAIGIPTKDIASLSVKFSSIDTFISADVDQVTCLAISID